MERAIKARGTWGCLMGLGSRNSPPGRRIAANGVCFSTCFQLIRFPPKFLPSVFQIGGPAVYLVAFMHASPDRSFCLCFTLLILMPNLNFSRSLPPTSLPFSCSFLAGRLRVGSPTSNTRTCEHLCAHTLRQVFRGSSRLRNVLFC